MMTTLTIAEARNGLAEAINRVAYAGERILFTRHGKPVGGLVSAADLQKLQQIEDGEDMGHAEKVLRKYEKSTSSFLSLDDYKRTLP